MQGLQARAVGSQTPALLGEAAWQGWPRLLLGHTGALVRWLLPRLGMPFVLWVAGKPSSGFKVLLRSPLQG